ncbi:MAG: type II secretion system protein GspN [Nitrospirae bacterium]|nr:type II secretion system protein GspN [Nitrospirota bacterium]
MKKPAAALLILLVLAGGLWYIAIPASLMSDLIENSLGRDYLYLRTEGLDKGLFYSFSAARVLLEKRALDGGRDVALLSFNDVEGRLELLSLLMLRPELSFHCSMNGGRVKGLVRLTGKDRLLIKADGVHIGGIPLFEPLGIYGDGILSGKLVVRNISGELTFSVKEVRLGSATLGGVFLPLDLFHDIRGAAAFKGTLTEVKSFAMEGTGVYARVRGNMRGADMNMNLELMTDSSFQPGPLFQTALERYRVSPGYYAIPLRGGMPLAAGGG